MNEERRQAELDAGLRCRFFNLTEGVRHFVLYIGDNIQALPSTLRNSGDAERLQNLVASLYFDFDPKQDPDEILVEELKERFMRVLINSKPYCRALNIPVYADDPKDAAIRAQNEKKAANFQLPRTLEMVIEQTDIIRDDVRGSTLYTIAERYEKLGEEMDFLKKCVHYMEILFDKASYSSPERLEEIEQLFKDFGAREDREAMTISDKRFIASSCRPLRTILRFLAAHYSNGNLVEFIKGQLKYPPKDSKKAAERDITPIFLPEYGNLDSEITYELHGVVKKFLENQISLLANQFGATKQAD